MTSTAETAATTASTQDPREALGERIFNGAITTTEMFTVHLGVELGLYEALAQHGPQTAGELAERTGVAERYAREWLEQQAVAGFLHTDGGAESAAENGARRRFRIDPAHADVLVDTDSPYYAAGAALMLAGIARVMPQLADAFRGGRGIPYPEFGTEIRRGIAAFNRPAFLHELGSEWLPSVPDLHERLSSAPRARVLDLGCGTGTSSTAIARAYPHVEVVGIDLDHASVLEARAAARETGLSDRVTFHLGDAADEQIGGGFDLVTIFEALHDMGDPAGALRTARRLLADGGSVIVADERVADAFTAPGDELERLNYGFSVLHCLPATLAEDPVEANGTVLRAGTVRRWATEAGFGRVEELPIDFPFWRFYRLAG
jgi:2-polyprenyl-3-methyl-5-hydroxy-6-metoxy-1,4-benzoquinol methylase